MKTLKNQISFLFAVTTIAAMLTITSCQKADDVQPTASVQPTAAYQPNNDITMTRKARAKNVASPVQKVPFATIPSSSDHIAPSADAIITTARGLVTMLFERPKCGDYALVNSKGIKMYTLRSSTI